MTLITFPAISDVSGSGFFVTEDGYFVTNYHVIKEANQVYLRDIQGQDREAKVIRFDNANDLAVLKVDGRFRAIPIVSSHSAKRGSAVVTIGYPHTDIQGSEPKITEGIINSLSGMGNAPRLFQISVSIQAGNSGGPLVTKEGNVIGIVASKLSPLFLLKETGDLPQNVNYAIKSNYLIELLFSIPQLKEKLLQPSNKTYKNLTDLTAMVEKATAIVIAQGATRTTTQPVKTHAPQPSLRVVDFPDTGILSPYIIRGKCYFG